MFHMHYLVCFFLPTDGSKRAAISVSEMTMPTCGIKKQSKWGDRAWEFDAYNSFAFLVCRSYHNYNLDTCRHIPEHVKAFGAP